MPAPNLRTLRRSRSQSLETASGVFMVSPEAADDRQEFSLLPRKSQKSESMLRFVRTAAICSDGTHMRAPNSDPGSIMFSGGFRNWQTAKYWHVPNLLPHLKFFLRKRLTHKGYPLSVAEIVFRQFFGMRGHEQFSESKSPPYRGVALPHAHQSSLEMRRTVASSDPRRRRQATITLITPESRNLSGESSV
jgi:hypothetical protein